VGRGVWVGVESCPVATVRCSEPGVLDCFWVGYPRDEPYQGDVGILDVDFGNRVEEWCVRAVVVHK
jgi:hypothetical protein